MHPFLRDRLSAHRVRVVAWMVLTIVVTLQIISFATATDRQTIFGPLLGADFAGFYNAGRILNHSPSRLYDVALHSKLYHELFPTAPAEESLPYAHAPFFALLMLPLGLLSYPLAYLLFLIAQPAVYIAGLLAIRPVLKHLDADALRTAALLALSYLPFLIENWMGGQVAAFGFLWMAIALNRALSQRPFAGGLALSMCLYKPTLLVLLLPLLLIGRQFRTLLGVAAGGIALVGVSLLTIGLDGCAGYLRLLLNYGAGASAAGGFRTFKYVDVVSFFRLAFGETILSNVLVIGVAAALLVVVARVWWDYPRHDDDGRRLAWAAALTLTPILNIYAPIYDTLLPILGLLLTADVLARRHPAMPDGFKLVLVLTYIAPMITQGLAATVGFQLFTLVLIGVGLYQLRLAQAESAIAAFEGSSANPRRSG
jgi:hypothetical protein